VNVHSESLESYVKVQTVPATESDPVALEHFELAPESVSAEVLGGESMEVWALRLSGGLVRDLLTTDLPKSRHMSTSSPYLST
jgi:hypothetical protein